MGDAYKLRLVNAWVETYETTGATGFMGQSRLHAKWTRT